MYRDVMLCGKPDWVFQICDVMVHPKERGVMTRQGPFLLTAAASAQRYLWPTWLWLSQRARHGGGGQDGPYAEVGQMSEVRWDPSAHRFACTRLQVLVKSGCWIAVAIICGLPSGK